ncbi:hemolysin III [Singulisphaera sp. GP187]|uniref:PAQR family membrane homeostasis protein TrhA n=1 Tax=Singulisphaera sp. GP187 TaxID=1882752 RepID=UPI000929B063|nr:hemolysin III family protein [Singulisphaera sp. GP187]SIO58277.1 hemolysin III [Singulisphaera sp. GP187]
MNFFDLREPVSAWSHGAWLLLAFPGSILLWLRAGGHRTRQAMLLGYTICLALCATASTLYHSVHGAGDALSSYLLFDHIGIYLLIAGTYTPIAWTLMRGPWRFGTLAFAWLSAFLGITLHLACANLPKWLPTGLYLLMGWGSILCYIELARNLSFRLLRPILVGGAFYSVGAIINVVGWPILWPGVIGPHEIFHVFVVAGSVVHFQFMLRVIAPWSSGDQTAAAFLNEVQVPAGSSLTPHPVSGFGPGRMADGH